MKNYQPLYTNGSVSNRFDRECKDRYDFFKSILSEYKRPFTVLDIGANLSYFGRRITEDFPLATVVSVEQDAEILTRGMSGYPLIGMNKKINSDLLRVWSTSEMFDVVFCLSIFHHLPKADALKAAVAAMSLGFEVFIEIPGKDDIVAGIRESNFALHELLENYNVRKEFFPSPTTRNVKRPTYIFNTFGKHIFTQWVNDCGGSPFNYNCTNRVVWNGKNKLPIFVHSSGYERAWIPGINLELLEKNNGYISGENMVSRLSRIKVEKPHGDINAHNVIVSRNDLHLIDYGHYNRTNDDEALLELLKVGSSIISVV
jgi:trans-aconitate methyltransferase